MYTFSGVKRSAVLVIRNYSCVNLVVAPASIFLKFASSMDGKDGKVSSQIVMYHWQKATNQHQST